MNNKPTFQEVALHWLEQKRPYVKTSTASLYYLHLSTHLIPAFGALPSLTEEQVQAWVDGTLAGGLSPKTVKDILLVLKMVLRFGQKQRVWEALPLDIHFPTQRENDRPSVLSVVQQRKLMTYLRTHPSTFHLGLTLCLGTGLRIGELCALTWADLDLSEGVVRVSKTLQRIYLVNARERSTRLMLDSPKTPQSQRLIPLTRDLLAQLRPEKAAHKPGDYLLTGKPLPMEPRACRRRFQSLLKRLGMPPLRFHGLRHSFATRCIESDCDIKTVSSLLGHANVGTTLHYYVHPDLVHQKKCVEKMSRYLK